MDINNALELIQRKLYGWMRELIRMLPNLLLAAFGDCGGNLSFESDWPF
jgi:hypothetical protein